MEADKRPAYQARCNSAWHEVTHRVKGRSMVAIDNTTLALLFHPGAKPPNDPKTGHPLVKARERIEQLITDLDAEDERRVIRRRFSVSF